MTALLRALYRVRVPLFYAAVLTTTGTVLLRRLLPEGPADPALAWIIRAGLAVMAVWLLVVVLGGRVRTERGLRVVHSPVTGRWLAINSPASKVPSHGVRGYGQAYAIDLVAEPEGALRPQFGDGPGMRPNADYPAFDEPVRAMVDGVVVAATDRRRDHLSRSRAWALYYMLLEGMVRELGGPGNVVGNHVTIRADDGTYALVAHLRQGSATVRRGDTVRAGDVVGRCGNSGNSSEPHVHAQLMDRRSLWTAAGVPMAFARISIGDADSPVDALPGNEEHMTATEPVTSA
ncbi:M23 family metallopeptidase [Georgenia sp. Z1491]|uniref:M23 family metallopeptidase n=1 Tax=Georgenia sp. Z1491 TaxID=3416707 RepID=UPI003CEC0F7D